MFLQHDIKSKFPITYRHIGLQFSEYTLDILNIIQNINIIIYGNQASKCDICFDSKYFSYINTVNGRQIINEYIKECLKVDQKYNDSISNDSKI